MRTLVIVPTYNESENIDALVSAVMEQVSSRGDSRAELLIVDDNSPDGTGQIADQLVSRFQNRVHVLHREKKQGLGPAYKAGFRWGLENGYDTLIEMDADFSHRPTYLNTMIDLLQENDVVIGSRYVLGGGTMNWGLGRKIISRGGSLYARLILGAPVKDFTGGFNGWRRAVLEAIDLDSVQSNGYSFQIELKFRAFRKGFKIKEFPIIFEDRKVGNSKMSSKIVLEALKRVWEFRLQGPPN